MCDTEIMTLGMWVDYVVEWNSIHLTEHLPERKRATQADFDAF
jgi:hypothetical protein